jgi:rhodanese-related sulfurtransferase
MKRIILLLFIVLIASCKEQIAQSLIVSVEEFKTMVLGKDVQLVDVRTEDEYTEGHIDDAVNIDFFEEDVFDQKFAQFDKDQPIYIYCRSGGRSQKSAKKLQELGFKEIIDLKGGYEAWIESK